MTKSNIVIFLVIATGVLLCIGGVWVAPLLIPGGMFITAGLGMIAKELVVKHARQEREQEAQAQRARTHHTNTMTFTKHHSETDERGRHLTQDLETTITERVSGDLENVIKENEEPKRKPLTLS